MKKDLTILIVTLVAMVGLLALSIAGYITPLNQILGTIILALLFLTYSLITICRIYKKEISLYKEMKFSYKKYTGDLKDALDNTKYKLKEAEDLKEILLSLRERTDIVSTNSDIGSYIPGTIVPTNSDIAVYIDDLFSDKKVIKQEANPAILIEKNGNVKEGFTRDVCDKGRKYKLVQK